MGEALEYQSSQLSPLTILQQEFEAKNQVLRTYFEEISPGDYLEAIFPDKVSNDDFIPVIIGTLLDKKGNVVEKGTVQRLRVSELFNLGWKPNVYLPYADFKNNYYHSKTLQSVRAFIVDLDGVNLRSLTLIARYAFSKLPKPSYVINSGQGIHLVYALDTPVEVKGLRWTINRLNRAIQSSYESLANLDKHPVVHPYRFPGFSTKINTIARAFRVSSHYNLEELLKLFEIPLKKSQVQETTKGSLKTRILYFPNGSRKFYEWFIWKLFHHPPIPGRRHNSFFALGIVSYKCKRYVPYQEAKEVVDMVYDIMERRNLHLGFTREEAHRAFDKGYNNKAVKVRWKYLCELLNWEYRPNKRNGRSRQEHLKIARQVRALYQKARKEEKEEHIKRLLAKGYKKSEIAEMLGITRQNLYKTYGHILK